MGGIQPLNSPQSVERMSMVVHVRVDRYVDFHRCRKSHMLFVGSKRATIGVTEAFLCHVMYVHCHNPLLKHILAAVCSPPSGCVDAGGYRGAYMHRSGSLGCNGGAFGPKKTLLRQKSLIGMIRGNPRILACNAYASRYVLW